jgi:putative membrane protein
VAKIVPAITKSSRWSYTILGVGFAVVGLVVIAYGLIRRRAVETALAQGEYVNPDERCVTAIMLVGVILGLGTLVLIVASS